MPTPSRSSRYSGSERPACRMNHTGVCEDRLAPRRLQERARASLVHPRSLSRGPVPAWLGPERVKAGPRCTHGRASRDAPGRGGRRPRSSGRRWLRMRAAVLRPEVLCEEMPAPQRIAPYAAALSADVTVDGERHRHRAGSSCCTTPPATTPGRAPSAAWPTAAARSSSSSSPTRCWPRSAGPGSSRRSPPTAPSTSPPPAPSPGWPPRASAAWPRTAAPPRSRSAPRGRRSTRPASRAHVEAWGELLCTAAGLEPVPDGVAVMPSRRGQRGSS